MGFDPNGAIGETLKYLLGGFAGASMSNALEYELLGQIGYMAVVVLMILALVALYRKSMPFTEEELLEETVRETVEDTVPQAVRDSMQEELQGDD